MGLCSSMSSGDFCDVVISPRGLDLNLKQMAFPVLSFGLLQHALAKRAVDALEKVHGTKYTYGSMISTICTFKRPPTKLRVG